MRMIGALINLGRGNCDDVYVENRVIERPATAGQFDRNGPPEPPTFMSWHRFGLQRTWSERDRTTMGNGLSLANEAIRSYIPSVTRIRRFKLDGRPPFRQMVGIFAGAFVAIAALALVGDVAELPFILGSFGASCFIVFVVPDSPFAQPRSVIGGHFCATFVGLAFLTLVGPHWWSMALAVATSISVMQVTRTPHPPAASNPVIVMLTAPGWSFLFFPTLIGACLLVGLAFLCINKFDSRSYPRSWF